MGVGGHCNPLHSLFFHLREVLSMGMLLHRTLMELEAKKKAKEVAETPKEEVKKEEKAPKKPTKKKE